MSYRPLNQVWQHSKQTGSHLLVLVAIADSANDDGECYPGVSNLADKCKMKDRNLQRIIRDLEASGELQVDYFQGIDTKRGPTNRYRIVMDGVQGSAPLQPENAPVNAEGVQGSAPVRVQGSAPNPSVDPNTKDKDSSPKKTATRAVRKSRTEDHQHDGAKPASDWQPILEATVRALDFAPDSYAAATKAAQLLGGRVPEKSARGSNGEWYANRLERGMDAAEIADFGAWLKTHYTGTEPIRKAATINDYAGRFRAAVARQAKLLEGVKFTPDGFVDFSEVDKIPVSSGPWAVYAKLYETPS